MIFRFDDTLKTNDDKAKHLLAKCLILMNEKGHHIERSGFYFNFIEKEIIVTAYMGQMDIDLIHSNGELYDATTSNLADYRYITVGCGENMYSPTDAHIILNEPSIVVVENERNDGSVIKRWAECYQDDDNIGDLNKTVFEALDDGRVRFVSAGGGDGTIVKKIEDQLKLYGSHPQLKITTVFDSDKSSANDNTPHNQALIYFLTEGGFDYHCLVKREMENYFPLKVYAKCGLIKEGFDIPEFSEEEWDYFEIKEEKEKKKGEQEFLTYEKRFLPDLAERAKKKHFRQRLSHQPQYNCHYGEVDEIQHILLMLAKFV